MANAGLVGDRGLGANVDSVKAARGVTHDPKGMGAGRVCDRGAGAGVGEFREDSTARRKRGLSVVEGSATKLPFDECRSSTDHAQSASWSGKDRPSRSSNQSR